MGRKENAGFGWMTDAEFGTYAGIKASKGQPVYPAWLQLIALLVIMGGCLFSK